ncbi:hypothetical protein ACIQU6_38485 [Streptomyces sp. NPDC090442]|uniref:hypothetical protein n=1 Tax=Streptomyces sp. NPDC090442 TaxID=3365962 RepID=UPI003830DCDF
MTRATDDPWRGVLAQELPSFLAFGAFAGLGIPAALAFFRGEAIAHASAGTWFAMAGVTALVVPVLALLGWWGERTERDALESWSVNAAVGVGFLLLLLLDGGWTITLARLLN